jgi:hypothetical protein
MHLVSELEAQLILSLWGEQDSPSTESGDESPPPPRDGFSRFGEESRSDERDLVEPDADWLPGDFDPMEDEPDEAA